MALREPGMGQELLGFMFVQVAQKQRETMRESLGRQMSVMLACSVMCRCC